MEAIALILIAGFQAYILKKMDKFDERMDDFADMLHRKEKRRTDNE